MFQSCFNSAGFQIVYYYCIIDIDYSHYLVRVPEDRNIITVVLDIRAIRQLAFCLSASWEQAFAQRIQSCIRLIRHVHDSLNAKQDGSMKTRMYVPAYILEMEQSAVKAAIRSSKPST